jgi:hypothetical protein
VKLTNEQTVEQYQMIGLPPPAAGFMAWLEKWTADGGEDRMNDAVEKVTGKAPKTLESWIQENKKYWQ